MIRGGLVSVTFRQLSTDDIIDLVKSVGLQAIEWGGDVHVPHGDIQCAIDTRHKTENAGLSVASYGSYYRVGLDEPVPYEVILETALALNAPLIRVWAGRRNAEDADLHYWQRVVTDAREISTLTASAGLKVAFEYHGNTLTNSLSSTLKLLKEVGHPALTSYWQAPADVTMEENLIALDNLLPWLSNIHVYTEGHLPLGTIEAINNSNAWRSYLVKVNSTGRNHDALIEFVQDDNPEQFIKDAQILNVWLQACQ